MYIFDRQVLQSASFADKIIHIQRYQVIKIHVPFLQAAERPEDKDITTGEYKIGEEIKSFEIDTFCHCSTVRWTHKMTEYGGDHHANKTERFQINFAVTKRL